MSKRRTYAPRVARPVHGGLRLQQSRRTLWWRRRWIEFLEGLHMGARLGRGRNYAQCGQVTSLTVVPGRLEATVQGAEEEPYVLSVSMDELPAAAVRRILEAEPTYAAQLYARVVPMAFEAALQREGLSLFPKTRDELRVDCSCRDWSKPCKHVAAALYLFIDALAATPQYLLRFRGIALEEPDTVPSRLVLPRAAVAALRPAVGTAFVPRRLGSFPYWRGSDDLTKTLETVYRRAAASASVAAASFTADFAFPGD